MNADKRSQSFQLAGLQGPPAGFQFPSAFIRVHRRLKFREVIVARFSKM